MCKCKKCGKYPEVQDYVMGDGYVFYPLICECGWTGYEVYQLNFIEACEGDWEEY